MYLSFHHFERNEVRNLFLSSSLSYYVKRGIDIMQQPVTHLPKMVTLANCCIMAGEWKCGIGYQEFKGIPLET